MSRPDDTIAVPDPAPEPPSRRTVLVPDPEPPRAGPSWRGLAVVTALAVVVGVLIFVLTRARRDAPERAAPSALPREGERPFGACRPEGRLRAVVATLHAREPVPHLPTIASWFPPEVPPHEIAIRGVEDGYGRSITFELHESGWSAWREIAGGARGEEICWRIGGWLREHGAGREEGARPDILGDRGPGAREEDLGSVAGLPAPENLGRLAAWLNPTGLRTSCEVEGGRFGLIARCRVDNAAARERLVRLSATLEVAEEEPVTQERDELTLAPRDSVEVPFPFDSAASADDARCRCQATPR